MLSDLDYDDFYDNEPDDDEDEFEEAMMNCGMYAHGGGCSLAGTEWCDWECPFSHELFPRALANPASGEG